MFRCTGSQKDSFGIGWTNGNETEGKFWVCLLLFDDFIFEGASIIVLVCIIKLFLNVPNGACILPDFAAEATSSVEPTAGLGAAGPIV